MKSKEKEFEKQELEEDMLEDGLKELMIKHVPNQSLADRLISQSNNHDQLRSTSFTLKLSIGMMGINEEEKKQPLPQSTPTPPQGKKGSGAKTVARPRGRRAKADMNNSSIMRSMTVQAEDTPVNEEGEDMFQFLRNLDQQISGDEEHSKLIAEQQIILHDILNQNQQELGLLPEQVEQVQQENLNASNVSMSSAGVDSVTAKGNPKKRKLN